MDIITRYLMNQHQEFIDSVGLFLSPVPDLFKWIHTRKEGIVMFTRDYI